MADFQSIVYQMILSVLRDAQITSANPAHTNTFKGLSDAGSSEIGLDEELKQAIREALTEITEDPDAAEKLADDLLDAEQKNKNGTNEAQASSLISKGVGIVQNPANIVQEGLRFLPHAALVLLAIKLSEMVFREIVRPGGLIDLRFKRILEDEFNAFLSRQTQKDTEIGVRQVIIQSKKGFTAPNGLNDYNTLRGIREGGLDKERLSRIGLADHAKGLF